MLYVPYVEIRFAQSVHVQLALACIFGAGAILWSILPRIDEFPPPGPRVEPDEQPRLFHELETVADAVDQLMPEEVYLIPEVNAWVGSRGSIMRVGTRRVMGLGLPLIQMLTVSQLRAVLTHEFGHYYGGDMALAPWVYKTRSAIIRTVEGLQDNIVRKPFVWYAKLFLRITNSIGRQQEYAADALAARMVGAQPLIAGLKATHQAGYAFDAYWRSEVLPVLSAGFRPPITEGFASFMEAANVARVTAEALGREMEHSEASPYDTHPCLRDRIAALSGAPAREAPSDDPPAITLVDDLASLEREMLNVMMGEENARALRDIDWGRTLHAVHLPLWRKWAGRVCKFRLPDFR